MNMQSIEHLTKLFSETEVPSIHQVLAALFKLRDRLLASVGNTSLPALLRVASQAALDVFEKYMSLFEVSGVYWVALGGSNMTKPF
jgi:hypothetical protein